MRIRHQEKEQTSRHIDQGDPLLSGMPAPFRARRSYGYGCSDATHAAVLSWHAGDGKALRCALPAPPAVAEQAEATGGEEELSRGFGHLGRPHCTGLQDLNKLKRTL
jgi:hypothetical protein